jgi:mono/diheme cytochrome c family protein
MRSNLFLVMAALATTAAGCASSARSVDTIDTANAIGDDAHALAADISTVPLSSRELTALRRAPMMQVADPAGLAGQITAPARWDEYLAGDTLALSAAERRGLTLFTRAGCASCHDALSVGGQEYRRLGEAIALRTLTDSGRYVATRDPADLFVFKVASLRNVQLTPPYLHDGSIKQLGQAVRLMGRHQLGVDLTEDQVSDIRAYLASLTGRVPLAAADRAPGGDR